MWDENRDIVVHQSFDQLYAGTDYPDNGPKNVFTPGASASWDKVVTYTDFAVDTLTYWGWIAFNGELGQFGYRINGGTPIYDDAWAWETGDDVVNAAKCTGADSGQRMKIAISLAGLEGTNTVTVLYKNAEGEAVVLNEFTVVLPVKPKDITNLFQSNVISNAPGTDLKNSDLSGYFNVEYGAFEPHKVIDQDGTLLYTIGGFNALSVNPNGKYAFTVKDLVTEGAGFSGIFVRAIRAATPEQQFYGSDGNDGAATGYGGSGIYIAMEDADTLRINIKSYVDGKYIPNIYTIEVPSNNITVADDGEVVYILSDNVLVATVAINGTADYGIEGVAADVASASAILSLWDGNVHVIENAILAAACNVENTIGMATRGHGNMTFSEVSVLAYSSITVPELEIPGPEWNKETLVIDMGTLGGPSYMTDFMPAGYYAPLQLLGYGVAIDLGQMDLSQFSAVKITYGCDGGPGTETNFANASSLAIGLKSENSSYGQETDDNFNGDIAHTDMVFSDIGWAAGAREAVVDLTNVNYNGNVWVAVHNPQATQIAISAIVFVP